MSKSAAAKSNEIGPELDARRPDGTFGPGWTGRPKGIPDRRSQAKSEYFKFIEDGDPALNLPPRRDRLAALLVSGDLQVQAILEKFLWEAQFGKAKETKDITIHGEVVEDAKDHMGGKVWGQLAAVPDEATG